MTSLGVFADAAYHTTSPYWKQMLLDASMGKFPSGYSFRDGVVTYRSKRGASKQDKMVCPSDPTALAAVYTQFLKRTSGIMSENEQSVHSGMDAVVPTRWSQVRSATQRKQMLEAYVNERCTAVGLTSTKARTAAMHTLLLGFCLGAFPAVHMSPDGRIAGVDGFDYSEEARKFVFKKPAARVRKAVTTDVVCDEEHTTSDATWIKPWVKLLRIIMRLPDDSTLPSAIPSVTDDAYIFPK